MERGTPAGQGDSLKLLYQEFAAVLTLDRGNLPQSLLPVIIFDPRSTAVHPMKPLKLICGMLRVSFFPATCEFNPEVAAFAYTIQSDQRLAE